VLYPNSAVIGRSRVRRGSVIAQGVSVVNRDTEPDRLVFQGASGELVFKPAPRRVLADIFREV
jgi:serine O-acetyltransferase